MPSPFPGMDPYLEDPALWPDVHHELISVIRESLNRQVGANYFVRVEERVYICDDDDPGLEVLIPDVRIGVSPTAGNAASDEPPAAAVDVAEPIIATTFINSEFHEPRLEIVDRHDRRLITLIEVISPSNKVARSRGRASYQEKRREIMTSPSHFVEIDLLRRGAFVLPRRLQQRGVYFIHVSRAEKRPKGAVWPVWLKDRLPKVLIPLKAPDPDVTLDLQSVLETAYDRAGWQKIVDYRAESDPALPSEQAAWADELLKSKGLR